VYLSGIVLENFRNYKFLDAVLNPGLNIFMGDNAQGKTNILESIYLLATGKSFRTHKDSDLINWNESHAVVKGQIERRYGSITAEIRMAKLSPKTVKLGGNIQRRLSDYFGEITVVVFSPEDIQLVKGGPTERRRYLDMSISQVNTPYCKDVSSYAKILQQRNAALRDIRDGKRGVASLEPWTAQLINIGSRIMLKRFQSLQEIAPIAESMLQKITSGHESLKLEYLSPIGDVGSLSASAVEEKLKELANFMEKQEISRTSSLVGPHRDDFSISVNGYDLRTYGSQGQQRSSTLALKLAEVEFIRVGTGENPILLLDDVMSELDHHRQRMLLSSMGESIQTLVTTTDLNQLKGFSIDAANVFTISNGQLIEDSDKQGG
jgi:DNA replication and repair protein RecF